MENNNDQNKNGDYKDVGSVKNDYSDVGSKSLSKLPVSSSIERLQKKVDEIFAENSKKKPKKTNLKWKELEGKMGNKKRNEKRKTKNKMGNKESKIEKRNENYFFKKMGNEKLK